MKISEDRRTMIDMFIAFANLVELAIEKHDPAVMREFIDQMQEKLDE